MWCLRIVCSICGLTEEFHNIEDESDGTPDVHAVYGDIEDGIENTSPSKRPMLRLDVSRPVPSPTRSTAVRLPAMTFGSIVIPHRFLGRVREDSLGGSYKGQFTVHKQTYKHKHVVNLPVQL